MRGRDLDEAAENLMPPQRNSLDANHRLLRTGRRNLVNQFPKIDFEHQTPVPLERFADSHLLAREYVHNVKGRLL